MIFFLLFFSLSLKDGVKDRVLQASVFITFDNTDARLPVDGIEVTVGRVLGIKKDEYFIQGKLVKKADISALLDAAGFSRSNPYYIVAQGEVQKLTRMSDADRLALLKEVAGTRVYEDKRKESLIILEDTDAKRKATVEVLTTIDERIEQLAEEQKELEKFASVG